MNSLYDYKNILDSVMLLVKLSNKGIAKRFALNAKKKTPKNKNNKKPPPPPKLYRKRVEIAFRISYEISEFFSKNILKVLCLSCKFPSRHHISHNCMPHRKK